MAKRRPDRAGWASTLAMLLLLLVALAGAGEGVGPAGAAPHHHHRPPTVVAVGQPAPGPMATVASVACGDARHCWAVGLGSGTSAAIDATADGGVRWASQPVPPSITVLASVSCPGPRDCVAVGAAGAAGAVLTTRNAGATWAAGQIPNGALALVAVACPSVADCVALVTDGTTWWSALSTDLGASWTRGGELPAGMTPTGLSCPTTAACVATGTSPTSPGHGAGAIALSANANVTWTPGTLPAGVGILRGITCAPATCIAVGTPSTAMTGFVPASGQILSSPDQGGNWQVLPVSARGDDAFGVACPEHKVCVVVGTDWVGHGRPVPEGGILSTLDGGQTWRPATLRYVPVGLSSVACPAVNECVAAGGDVLVRVTVPVKPPPPKHPTTTATRPAGSVR